MRKRLVVCYSSMAKDAILGKVNADFIGFQKFQYENAVNEPLTISRRLIEVFGTKLDREQFMIWSSNDPSALHTAGVLGIKLGIREFRISALLNCSNDIVGQPCTNNGELSHSFLETEHRIRCARAISKISPHIYLGRNIIVITDAASARHIRDAAKPLNEYSIVQKMSDPEYFGGVLVFEANLIVDNDPDKRRIELFHDAY